MDIYLQPRFSLDIYLWCKLFIFGDWICLFNGEINVISGLNLIIADMSKRR